METASYDIKEVNAKTWYSTLAEAADLRRQVEHANRWRDSAILEANEARAEAADLRRQLAACQAELYGMRAQLGDVRVLRMQLESDNVALRRQLAEAQAELARLRGEVGDVTDEQLQAIAALCDAATPGPWERSSSGFTVRHAGGSVATMGAKEDAQAKADAAFIANARQAVPELLAFVADLRRQLAEVQAEIAAVPRPEIGELCDLIDNSTTAISLDCPAGWAVREWLETYDAADCRQERDAAIADAAELRRQLTEERMRANAAEFAVAQLSAEAADLRRQVDRAGYEYREVQRALVEVGEATGADDPTSPESILDALASLRRQLEHANRWRDNEILAANEARADAADLRRQLDDARQIYGVSQHAGGDIERLLWEAAEAIVLRRQLEYANRWRESAILDANEARSEAADLRRQLAECQEIAAARGESLGYETADEWNDNPATDANDARQEAAKLRRQLDRERIAAIQHAIWSHWMTYQFSVCLRNDDGTMTIPAQKVMRWERQAATPYAELSEAERESDRHQADRILVAAVTPHRAGKGDA